VMDGTHYDSGCCFDYGNASTNGRAVGAGTMETTYFGTSTVWVLEAVRARGLWPTWSPACFRIQPEEERRRSDHRFLAVHHRSGRWRRRQPLGLRGGNAQQGSLTTFYSGVRPNSRASSAYYPMHKQGAILLGTGGDNGNGSSAHSMKA